MTSDGGYDHAAYPNVPNANGPQPSVRPWTHTTAFVAGFIAAGIEIIAGFIFLAGGSLIGAVEGAAEDLGAETSSVGGLFVLLGLASLAVGGCYIWGGVVAVGGKNGVVLGTVAGVAVVLNLITLIASGGESGILGLLLAAVVLGTMLSPPTRTFIRRNGGRTW